MGEDFIPVEGKSKKQKYEHIMEQLEWRIDPQAHPQSNRNNLISLLKFEFNWWWVGYYFVHKQKLVLGAFQGPPACATIFKGKGVCGATWIENRTVKVPNVNEFPGHIACSSKSQSQIVVPIRRDGQFVGLLDIDSERLAQFDEIDQQYLQAILAKLEKMNQFEDWK